MKIHRRLIVLVGLGMLLILLITVLSLQNISGAFSRTTRELAQSSLEYEKIWDIEKSIADLSLALHNFVETGNEAYQRTYAAALTEVRQTLNDISSLDLNQKETTIVASLIVDIQEMEKKADRILSHGRRQGRIGRLLRTSWPGSTACSRGWRRTL